MLESGPDSVTHPPADDPVPMSLNPRQKKHLRGLAHHLQPVVMVGDKGLSESVLEEIERALHDHELIKVKLRAERDERKRMAEQIARRCKAEPVHAIGQVACFYRRRKDKPAIELPG